MRQLIELGDYLFGAEKLRRVSFIGNCHVWTRDAWIETRRYADLNKIPFVVEAREKNIAEEHDHTFLRVTLNNVRYVYDGTGFLKNVPWWGNEVGTWYEGSRQDVIDIILRSKCG